MPSPVTTLSFHKVKFDAQEVLDFLDEQQQAYDPGDVESAYVVIAMLTCRFLEMAESRSRIKPPEEPPPTAAVPAKPKQPNPSSPGTIQLELFPEKELAGV